MTAQEFAAMIGRPGDAQGCVRVGPTGIVEQKLGDGNWYAFADVVEFIHRHMKHLDEGGGSPQH